MFTTQAYHLSPLVFKYQLAPLFIHVTTSLSFIVVVFLLVVSLALSKLDFILTIVFQFEPTSPTIIATTISNGSDCDIDL